MYQSLFLVLVLVAFSGTFSGLTLALFSLNLSALERKIRMGDQKAEKVYQIRKHGNLLLCTLLLGNVASYTFMTIILKSLTTGIVAGVIATALIFIFGEILPQAVFPRYALNIGAKLSGFVRVLLVLFYPVAAPIAWTLNKVLGTEPPVLWNKKELEEIIKYHEDVGDGIIDEDEERIILGALSFSVVPVSSIMIHLDDVFSLEEKEVLNQDLLNEIKAYGYSKIPVFQHKRDNIVGIIYLKNLIGILPSKKLKVEDLYKRNNLIQVNKSMKLDDLFNQMVLRKTQIAIIVDDKNRCAGIATLEDIMEKILNTNLEDDKS